MQPIICRTSFLTTFHTLYFCQCCTFNITYSLTPSLLCPNSVILSGAHSRWTKYEKYGTMCIHVHGVHPHLRRQGSQFPPQGWKMNAIQPVGPPVGQSLKHFFLHFLAYLPICIQASWNGIKYKHFYSTINLFFISGFYAYKVLLFIRDYVDIILLELLYLKVLDFCWDCINCSSSCWFIWSELKECSHELDSPSELKITETIFWNCCSPVKSI